MTTTYTVAANDLEGVMIRFAPHPINDFPFLHHTLNGVYGVDLYENDFHFLLDDITTNGQTELHKDAPKRLLAYMIDHIKNVSGSSGAGTRGNTTKVDELFGTMLLSYRLKNGRAISFQRGQDLATGILHFLTNQRDDVPVKCMEVLLSISKIYPSPIGIVDGLNMDKLFSNQQAIPPPTQATTNAAATAGTHLATIATTMSSTICTYPSTIMWVFLFYKRAD